MDKVTKVISVALEDAKKVGVVNLNDRDAVISYMGHHTFVGEWLTHVTHNEWPELLKQVFGGYTEESTLAQQDMVQVAEALKAATHEALREAEPAQELDLIDEKTAEVRPKKNSKKPLTPKA